MGWLVLAHRRVRGGEEAERLEHADRVSRVVDEDVERVIVYGHRVEGWQRVGCHQRDGEQRHVAAGGSLVGRCDLAVGVDRTARASPVRST